MGTQPQPAKKYMSPIVAAVLFGLIAAGSNLLTSHSGWDAVFTGVVVAVLVALVTRWQASCRSR